MLTKELDHKLVENSKWPVSGIVEFNDVSMRYRDGMEESLKELSFEVQAGMKVGVVGRTGAGKSTILQTLFRLTDNHAGSIKIDGTDITQVGLHLLRKHISYIP